MKSYRLLIAAAVLAALFGFLYWSNRHPPGEKTSTDTTPTEPAPKILTLNEGDINKVELKRKTGDLIVLAKDSNGSWQITAPKTLKVDQPAVSGLLSTLSSLSSERLVEEKAARFDQYGLSSPALEVDITDKNNAIHKLLIGDQTPTGNGAYARVDGDPRVFTIASYTKTGVDKSLNDLRDKRLITAEADKISRIELTVKQQVIEFGRDKEQWQILKPGTLRADGATVDDLVSKLTGATMDVAGEKDESKVAASFASGTVVATAKVTTDAGVQQLEVRKNKENYYAKSSVVDGIYQVPVDLGQGLDKKLDDFLNRKVFDFDSNDPAKIEIHDGTKAYFLTKGGEDWFSADGKKLNHQAVMALVDDLRDLTASEFVDSGFGTTAMEITITSSDSKRVEKVTLSKGSKAPLAKRANEGTLYQLDPQAIENLQKLTSELKPA